MERDPGVIMQYMVEVEAMAEEILADRQQIIDLDRRRQKTREAIRALHKDKTSGKSWVCFGDMFLKLPKHQAKRLLETDFDKLEEELQETHKQLKVKVARLKDLENKEELKGFDLQPLSQEEMRALNDIL